MAIKIGGTTTIDNNRNVSGNIGTFSQLNINLYPTIFSPSVGQTNVAIDANIILTFNQTVAISSSAANITIRQDSPSGTAISTVGVGSTRVTISGAQVTIDPPVNLGYATTYFPVIDAGAFKNNFGNVSTALTTYSFKTGINTALGATYEGGRIFCKGGGTLWVVSPVGSTVGGNWYARTNANTAAYQATGIATAQWFIPTIAQLQSGFNCKVYWDDFCQSSHWTDEGLYYNKAWTVNPANSLAYSSFFRNVSTCARAFRCVSY